MARADRAANGAGSPLIDPFRAAFTVPVDGGRLFVARAGPPPAGSPQVVVAIHGITASHETWRAMARAIRRRTDACVLAPDLRGRGRSAALPPPPSFATHTDDILALLDHLGISRALLVGHSMGAYVAAAVAAEHPERVSGVVLVDAGLPVPLEKDTDPDELLEATLGPALARLSMTFDSVERYVEFWHGHPAFARGWNDDVEAYVRADLGGEPGALRSVTSELAVRMDSESLLLDDDARSVLERVHVPIQVLRAERGLLDDDRVMMPDSLLDPLLARRPDIRAELVEDVNHYTIVMSDGAPRVADAVVRGLAQA
jgi:lipase